MALKDIAKNVLISCLAAKPGEEVLVVTDDTRVSIGQALYEGAKEIGCEAMLVVMQERELSGQEPPKAIAEAMKAADIVVCPTAKSLTHTNARINATSAPPANQMVVSPIVKISIMRRITKRINQKASSISSPLFHSFCYS